ncbi:cytochrome P450 [Trichoderma afarasin]
MISSSFHLLGEQPSTSRQITFPSDFSFADLQELVASHFAIVDSNDVGFIHQNIELTSVNEVRAATDPVAISISGKSVRDIPGPGGLPYVGSFFEVYPDHLGNHQRLFNKYGSLFVTTNMGSRIHHTNDPRLANIFFTESPFFSKKIIPNHPIHPLGMPEAGLFFGDTDSEAWRITHKFLPPALGPKAVRHYAPAMQKTVEESFNVFDKLDLDGEAWNVFPYMMKIGSQAVGRLVLGMDFNHFASVDAPLHEFVLKLAHNVELSKRVSSFGSWYANMPFGDPKKLRDNMHEIQRMIFEASKKASTGVEDLNLQDAALQSQNLVDYCLRARDLKGNRLSWDQFVPALVVLTGAGFVTSASLLSWMIYALVTYEGVQERLLQELIDHDWDENIQVTGDMVNELKFLNNFIKETQRTHNPSFQPARTALVDMILPGGYRLAKDSIVVADLHHIHNNPHIWDNAEKFDPDRWDTEKVKNRPAGSYQPFASGPRSCIGFNFALQEVKIVLSKLLYRYRFSLAETGTVEYNPYYLLIKPNNLYVRAERRFKWPQKTCARTDPLTD